MEKQTCDSSPRKSTITNGKLPPTSSKLRMTITSLQCQCSTTMIVFRQVSHGDNDSGRSITATHLTERITIKPRRLGKQRSLLEERQQRQQLHNGQVRTGCKQLLHHWSICKDKSDSQPTGTLCSIDNNDKTGIRDI